MKKISVLLLFLFIASMTYAQKFDLRISGGVSTSINNFLPPSTEHRIDYLNDKNNCNTLIDLGVNYYLFPGVYLGTGLNFAQYNYSQIIIARGTDYVVETVNFPEKYLSIPLNIGFEYKINNYYRLGIQYNLNYDISLTSETTYSNEVLKKYGYIDYNYELIHTPLKSGISHNISLISNIKMNEKFNLFFELGYNIRNNGTYKYTVFNRNTFTNRDTGDVSHETYNFQDNNGDLIYNFLFMKMGIIRKL